MVFGPKNEKPKGILDTVLSDFPEKEKIPKEIVAREVTEISKDDFGQMIETKKEWSDKDHLISERSYKEGKKFGVHKEYRQGILRKSSYYFDSKGRRPITISYDSSGKVIDAKCNSRVQFTEEHAKVCGFQAPFSYSTTSLGGKLEVTLDKGVEISKKQFFAKGGLWVDEKFSDDKNYRDVYAENGVLRSEHVREKSGWTEKRYNAEGLLLEKHIGYRAEGPYREEIVVYDPKGYEIAFWDVRKEGYVSLGCSLNRSLASEAPRPSICP